MAALINATPDAQRIDGQWVRILEARHHGAGAEYTPADLDAIIRNYRSRESDSPIGIGLNWSGAKAYGQIEDLRRDGNDLMGKLGHVAPQLEDIYSNGGFKTTAVALKKTATGASLVRVGFMNGEPNYHSGRRDDPRVDANGNEEIVFSEGITKMVDGPALRHMTKLKNSGHWRPIFDKCGFPSIFRILQNSDQIIHFGEGDDRKSVPAIAAFAQFVTVVAPIVDLGERGATAVGADADLYAAALDMSRQRGVSYCEALEFVVEERDQSASDVYFEESRARQVCSGVELNREAKKRARERGISYGVALEEVANERPDLTRH